MPFVLNLPVHLQWKIFLFNSPIGRVVADLSHSEKLLEEIFSSSNVFEPLNISLSIILEPAADDMQITINAQPNFLKNWWPSVIRIRKLVSLKNTKLNRNLLRKFIVNYLGRNQQFVREDQANIGKLPYYSMLSLKRKASELSTIVNTQIWKNLCTWTFCFEQIFVDQLAEPEVDLSQDCVAILLPYAFPNLPIGQHIICSESNSSLLCYGRLPSGETVKYLEGQLENSLVCSSYLDAVMNLVARKLDEYG